MKRLLPAVASLMLTADVALAQSYPAYPDRYGDERDPRYSRPYYQQSDGEDRVWPPAARQEEVAPGWRVSPRDWREAERTYGQRYEPAPRPRRYEPQDDDRQDTWVERYGSPQQQPQPGRRYDQPWYRPQDRAERESYREPTAPPVRQYSNPYEPRPPENVYGRRVDPEDTDRRFRPLEPNEIPRGQKVMYGGPRTDIAPMAPERVGFNGDYRPGTIVIETAGRQLFLVTGRGEALRYPISVGRQGFQWTGTEKISRIADWPDWHPPSEMRKREPYLPEKMLGGIKNPLGAKALYLGNSLYRIHGTNDARTIGYASSSGCFRMLNGHVVDLASRIGVGTSVVVVNRLSREVASARIRR